MPAGGKQNSKSVLDYLDTIGTKDRGDTEGLAMNNTAKRLVKLGGFLIETATANLQKRGNMATGQIASSMGLQNVDLKGTVMSLEVVIDPNYKWLNYGVNGVGKSGKGRYSFRYFGVSKKMQKALKRWVTKRGLGGRTKYAAKSYNERKNKEIRKVVSQVKSADSLAYAIGRSLKKKGIKPSFFFSNAIRSTQARQRREFGEGFKLDIIESIKGLNKN